jgi:hypothetical protein
MLDLLLNDFIPPTLARAFGLLMTFTALVLRPREPFTAFPDSGPDRRSVLEPRAPIANTGAEWHEVPKAEHACENRCFLVDQF